MASFRLEREDLALLQNQIIRQLRAAGPNGPLRVAISVVGGLLFGFGASALSKAYQCCNDTQPHIQYFLWLSFASITVFVGLAIWTKVQMSRAALSSEGWFLASQTVNVSEAGIDHVTKLGNSQLDWAGFQRRVEDEKNLYLFVEPSLGIIIPKSALSEIELSMIRSRVRSDA